MSNRAPTGNAMRSALPVTRQAAGVPSAWSQPAQSTHERPRRWRDAGPLGRECVTADQKAGDEDRFRDSDRVRDRGRGSGSGSGSGSDGTAADRGTRQPRSLGRAGYVVVPDRPTGTAARSAQLRYRALPGTRDEVCCSCYEAGRRRAIGVVAARSIYPRATTPMARRWSAGTRMRHSGSEGRG